jgi:hypothetical protein
MARLAGALYTVPIAPIDWLLSGGAYGFFLEGATFSETRQSPAAGLSGFQGARPIHELMREYCFGHWTVCISAGRPTQFEF